MTTPDQPAIEAKPTEYNDITFRSALEATWAGNLDRLGIKWEYEPQLFMLPSGAKYLPDFRLPELGTWLEVKGDGIPRLEKAVELGKHLACTCEGACTCDWPGGWLVIIGRPPKRFELSIDEYLVPNANYERLRNLARREQPSASWSTAYGRNAWFIRACPGCGRAGWMQGRCRACGDRCAGTHVYSSGEDGIKFHRGERIGGGFYIE